MQNPNQSGPPQLPPLVAGQQIKNGPYTVTVTDRMVRQREQENQELARRWEIEQRRLARAMDPDDYYGEFKEPLVRRRFVRRVFAVLTLQMIVTALIIGAFMFLEEVRQIMFLHPYLWIIALCTFMFTYISISCYEYARRTAPCNYINLVLLTLSLSYLTATVSVFYSVEAVLITAGATGLVTLIICGTATFTNFDLTRRTGLMMIIALVATLGLIILIVVMLFTQIRVLQAVIALIGTLLISMYLFFDIQTIMGGRMIELDPDEIVYATTQLYVDIVMLYRYLLMFWSCQDY